MKNSVREAVDFIRQYDSFLILPHEKPDGDALGSALGLKLGLEQLGKEAVIWSQEDLQESMKPFFMGEYSMTFPKRAISAVISVDTGDEKRLGERFLPVKDLPLLNIDHHGTNTLYGDANYVAGGLSSTGELVTKLLLELGVKLTEQMATALYVAIVTDTNRFFYSSTSPETLETAAILMKAGAKHDRINTLLYSEMPLAKLQLESFIIGAAEFLETDLVYARLTKEDMEGIGWHDSDDLVELLRDIEGVKVSALVYDYEGEVKLSLRSKDEIDVSKLAMHFGGGGHRNAAGASIQVDEIEELKRKLKELSCVGKNQSL